MNYREQVKAGNVNPNFGSLRSLGMRFTVMMPRFCGACFREGKRGADALPPYMGLELPKGCTLLANTEVARKFRRKIAHTAMVHYENEHSDHPMLKKAPWRRRRALVKSSPIVALESVGTLLRSDGITYTMMEDGRADLDTETPLSEIEPDGDWMNTLSDGDRIIVEKTLNSEGESN